MNALAPYIAALHQENLLEEAELRRLVKLSQGSTATVPAWRRGLGGGARAVSGLFASAARSIDPHAEIELAERERAGRAERTAGRAFAA